MADKFQLKAIITAVDKITPTLKGVARAARLTNKSLRDIGSAGSKLMGSLGLPAGLAFGSVVYGATRAAGAVMQFASGIQDATDRTGASIGGYQSLVNMLEMSGGSAEDAEMAFTHFNKGISEAAAGGNKSFAALLHKLKIPMKDAQGNVRTLTDMMPELADAFAKNTNPTLRSRMALELFERSGRKMLPVLVGGRKAWQDFIAEQQRLGTIVGDKSVTALDDLGDSMGVVGKQLKVQFTEALANMVPVIMPVIKSLQEWIANNKELIKTTITKTLTEIANALKDVDWVAFIGGIRDTIKGIGNFIESMGGMKNVLIALGVLWLAGPLSAIFSMIGAFARLVMVVSPVMLVVAAVAAAGYLIYSNWSGLSSIFGAFTTAVSSLGSSLLDLWNVLSPVLLPVLKLVGAIIGGVIIGVVKTLTLMVSGLVLGLSGVVSLLAKIAKFVIPDWLRNMMGGGETSVAINSAAAPTRPSLVQSGALQMAAGQQPLNGEMVVRFENAPAGMRVEPGRMNQPGVTMNPDVGYRSLGLGLGF